MAKKFLVNLDLNKNEIQNVVIHRLAVAPANPVNGMIYFNTSDERYYLKQTSGWKDVTGRLDDILTNTNAMSITDNGDGTLTIDIGNAGGANSGLLSSPHYTDLTNATNASTAGTLVKRDGSGDIAFNSAIANSVIINEVIDGATPLSHAVHKGYVDNLFSSGTRIQGSIDCSANPNYPVAASGDIYYVSVAGRIGGGAGPLVNVGDMIIAIADSVGGDDATVGSDWLIVEHNIDYATEAVAGIITIASTAEVTAGLDDTKAVTPAKLVAYVTAQITGGKHSADIGNGAASTFIVTHNLADLDIHVQIKDTTTNEHVECDIVVTSLNEVTLTFAVAPLANAYRVIVQA